MSEIVDKILKDEGFKTLEERIIEAEETIMVKQRINKGVENNGNNKTAKK